MTTGSVVDTAWRANIVPNFEPTSLPKLLPKLKKEQDLLGEMRGKEMNHPWYGKAIDTISPTPRLTQAMLLFYDLL